MMLHIHLTGRLRHSLMAEFQCLGKASLSQSKCEFAEATITYLGKGVGQGQVRPVAAKIIAVINIPRRLVKTWYFSRLDWARGPLMYLKILTSLRQV